MIRVLTLEGLKFLSTTHILNKPERRQSLHSERNYNPLKLEDSKEISAELQLQVEVELKWLAS